MFLRRKLILAALLAVIPTWGGAWLAFNRLEVFTVSDREFEVIGRVGSGPADYWCGAGDFVRNALRMPVVTRIYLSTAIGPSVNNPRRKAVRFSLTPPEGGDTSPRYSLSMKAVGDNLTAAAAYQYCLQFDELDPWLWRRP